MMCTAARARCALPPGHATPPQPVNRQVQALLHWCCCHPAPRQLVPTSIGMPLFRAHSIKGTYPLLFLSQRRPIGMAIIAQRLRLVPRITHHLQGGETRATAVESSKWRRETCSSGHAGPAGACTALLLNHRQQHAYRAVRSMLTWMSWRGPTRSGSYRTCRRAQAGVLSNTNWCQLPDS